MHFKFSLYLLTFFSNDLNRVLHRQINVCINWKHDYVFSSYIPQVSRNIPLRTILILILFRFKKFGLLHVCPYPKIADITVKRSIHLAIHVKASSNTAIKQVFLLMDYWLVVAPQKFNVPETNIGLLMLVLGTSNFQGEAISDW